MVLGYHGTMQVTPHIMAVTAWPLLSDNGPHKETWGTSSSAGRVLGD